MSDIRQATAYAPFLSSIGWKTIPSPNQTNMVAIKPLLPLFGILKYQRIPLDSVDFVWLNTLARKHFVFVNYIELSDSYIVPINTPFNASKINSFFSSQTSLLKKNRYSPINHGMLPTKTQIVDLNKPMDTLIHQMKAKTRYNIGLAQRKGVRVKTLSASELLLNQTLLNQVYRLLKSNAKRASYWIEPKNWIEKKLSAFGDQGFVLFALDKKQNELLSVAMYLSSQDSLFYWLNGSTFHGRKLFAPSLLVYEGINLAKKNKLKIFDFDGVYDERFPNKRWLGYSKFKQGFGGAYVFYPPCFIKRFAYF